MATKAKTVTEASANASLSEPQKRANARADAVSGITVNDVQAKISETVLAFRDGVSKTANTLAVLLAQFSVLTVFASDAWKAEKERVTTLLADDYSARTIGRIFSNVRTIITSSIPDLVKVAEAWTAGDTSVSPSAAYKLYTAHREATGSGNGDGRGKSGKRNSGKASDKNKVTLLSPAQLLAQFMMHTPETRASILRMLTEAQSKDVAEREIAAKAAAMAAEVDAKLAKPKAKAKRASK